MYRYLFLCCVEGVSLMEAFRHPLYKHCTDTKEDTHSVFVCKIVRLPYSQITVAQTASDFTFYKQHFLPVLCVLLNTLTRKAQLHRLRQILRFINNISFSFKTTWKLTLICFYNLLGEIAKKIFSM
uniref:Uncharacterized protein n=1 Tax=Cacopsylla melanoneura TaxID=428564 RepID=A0A8D8XHF9_9HEMI